MGDLNDQDLGEYFEEEGGGNPQFRFTPAFNDEDYEIVDDEESGPTREELAAEVERQRAEIEAAKSKTSGLAKEDLLEVLKEVRRGGSGAIPPAPQQQKGESDEEFMKRLNENLFEGNASELIIEAVRRFSGQAASPALQGNFEISKELVENSSELGPIYREYQEEVENEINKLPMNQRLQIPHIYKRATEEVARRHWKDLREKGVAEMVAEKLETMKEELKKELGISSGGGEKRNVIYSEPGVNRPTPNPRGTGKKRIRKPTPQEEKYAEIKGISWPQLYESLERQPQLAKRINEGGIPWLR